MPEQGEIWFNSVPVHTMGALARERLRRDRFGWIGPDPQLLPELKVWENAALPLLISGASHRSAKAAACEWLDRLDIGAFARKRPGALTRAESQRVALARALVKEPAIVFADEPTAPCTAPSAPCCSVPSPPRPARTGSPCCWPPTRRRARPSPTAGSNCSTGGPPRPPSAAPSP